MQTPVAPSDPERTADRYWGCADLDELFGHHAQVIAPWPRAPRRKTHPAFDLDDINALLRCPVDLAEIDPRELWSSQPWVLRRHADYYLTGRWERTGETSADGHAELNRFPVVITDHRERSVIVSGHHRATAALVEGRPLFVRQAAIAATCAVTPLLWWDPTADDIEIDTAAACLAAGQRVSVPTLEVAEQSLVQLDVDPNLSKVVVESVRARC